MSDLSNIMHETSKILASIYNATRGYYKIHKPEVKIVFPENIQTFSYAFEAKGNKIPPKLDFPNGEIIRINLRTIRGGVDLNDSIIKKAKGFSISTKNMQEHDLFLLDVDYKIKSQVLLQSLVERTRSKEVPNDEEDQYWMHAALKHPAILNNTYAKLILEDVDFNIDVGVSQDIDTVIPKSFSDELGIAIEMLKETDVHKLQALGKKKIQAQRRRGKNKDVIETLNSLQDLFLDKSFENYFEVKDGFNYYSCCRGSNYHVNTPFNLTWPKSMKITSRCDLNLDQCAVHGYIQYRRREFLDEVSKIIGRQ